MSNFFLVCFDVSNSKRLYRVARVLEAFGNRVQHSVFECWLDHKKLVKLKTRLSKIVDIQEDTILFYQLTEEERKSIILIGNAFTNERPKVEIL